MLSPFRHSLRTKLKVIAKKEVKLSLQKHNNSIVGIVVPLGVQYVGTPNMVKTPY